MRKRDRKLKIRETHNSVVLAQFKIEGVVAALAHMPPDKGEGDAPTGTIHQRFETSRWSAV